MAILSSYISDVDNAKLRLILTLMVLLAWFYSSLFLIKVIDGGSICAWMLALIQLGFVWSFMDVDFFPLRTVFSAHVVNLQIAIRFS